jgi:hypothetical protein
MTNSDSEFEGFLEEVINLYERTFSIERTGIIIRVYFFIVTGIVGGYLAREEHRRFNRILKQQRIIFITRQKRNA